MLDTGLKRDLGWVADVAVGDRLAFPPLERSTTMSDRGSWFIDHLANIFVGVIAAVIGGLILSVLLTHHSPPASVSHSPPASVNNGPLAVVIPMDRVCNWAYPGQATGSVVGSGYNIVCLGIGGQVLGGFPDASGHSLNDWCADSRHTDGMNLLQAKLLPTGWVCTVLS